VSEPDALEVRISTREAAKFLGVTRRHVEKLIHAGELPTWDVRQRGAGRARFVVTLASVRVFLEERRRITRTEAATAPAATTNADSAVRHSKS
jgi:excisionase family DNA binding protein